MAGVEEGNRGVLTVERLLPVAKARLATVRQDELLVDAARMLAGVECSLVIVCDGSGTAVGVITETDLVRRIGHCTGATCRMRAEDVMSRDIVSCHPDDRVDHVWERIKLKGLKHMPVLDGAQRPVGVLNARDVVEALLDVVQHEERLLRDYVACVGYR